VNASNYSSHTIQQSWGVSLYRDNNDDDNAGTRRFDLLDNRKAGGNANAIIISA